VERLRDGARVVLAGPPNAGKSTLLNLLCGREAAITSPVAGTTRDVVEVPVRRGGAAYLLQDTAGLHAGSGDPVEAVGMARAQAALAAADLVLWTGDEPPPVTAAVWLHTRADEERARPAGTELAVSRNDPVSVEAVWQLIERQTAVLPAALDAVLLGQRQRDMVEQAMHELIPIETDPLLLAEQLRRARKCLLRVTGGDATEALLDALFGRFCIGK
jgi:tRNA modification GTPase